MNPDIFAIISSADGSQASRYILDHDSNKIWSVPASNIPKAGQPSAPNCLTLTFSKLRAAHSTSNYQSAGIICLGTDYTCQIVLGYRGMSLLSPRHCYILVTDNLHIYVGDNASAYGTAVNYHGPVNTRDNHCAVTQKRQWIVALELRSERTLEGIPLNVGQITFNLQFPNHAPAHPQYIHNLRWLANACKETWDSTGLLPPADNLLINVAWKTKLYYLYRVISRKPIAIMYEGICTDDGKVVAIKQFSPRNDMSHEQWTQSIQREFDAMKFNGHVSSLTASEVSELTISSTAQYCTSFWGPRR